LPNSAKSALIPLFAGIKNRIGWKGEMRYGLLSDVRTQKHKLQYMVERYVALAFDKQSMFQTQIDQCSRPHLESTSEQQQVVRSKLGLNDERKVLGLCPGAEFGAAKRWPENHYAQVAHYAIEQGLQVWLMGSNKDNQTCEDILNWQEKAFQAHCHNLAGKTSLVEAVDLLANCHTVVTNDSGLMHVAAAVNTNIIAIYGSSSPQYTPPLTDKLQILATDIECRPCFQRECPLQHLDCLNKLPPSRAIQALNIFIGK